MKSCVNGSCYGNGSKGSTLWFDSNDVPGDPDLTVLI